MISIVFNFIYLSKTSSNWACRGNPEEKQIPEISLSNKFDQDLRQGNKVSISFWLLVFDIISTSDLFSLHWADLQLNQYPSYKYLAVGLSIGCGIFSVFLDLFFTICGLVSTHTWILFSCNSDLTYSNVCLLVC